MWPKPFWSHSKVFHASAMSQHVFRICIWQLIGDCQYLDPGTPLFEPLKNVHLQVPNENTPFLVQNCSNIGMRNKSVFQIIASLVTTEITTILLKISSNIMAISVQIRPNTHFTTMWLKGKKTKNKKFIPAPSYRHQALLGGLPNRQ